MSRYIADLFEATFHQIRKTCSIVARIDWKYVWKQTLQTAFPCGLEPLAVSVSPLTVPFLFVLCAYEAYNVQKLIDALSQTLSRLHAVFDHLSKNMYKPMTSITSQNFDLEVLQSIRPVLLLWASFLDVNSNQLAAAMTKLDKPVKIARVDIDESPDLVMRYSVRTVPLIVLFVGGLAIASDTTLSDKLLQQVS